MTGNTTGETGREGLFAGLRNLFATLLSIGRTRAELLVLEIEEEKLRLISMWSKAIGAAFLFAIGLIMAVFSIALAFWEQRAQARKPSRLFRSSLSELDEDIAQLRGRPQE